MARGQSQRTEALALYDSAACASAAQIMARYSTSFSLATRLLADPLRTDIRNLYAVVRTADEIVDSGLDRRSAAALLDAYEDQVRAARDVRFHTDPVVHAFAWSARRCGFADEHLAAFFASMRRDLDPAAHTPASLAEYIYGSAEVIGLLCLDAFYSGGARPDGVDRGARALGAAFQKVNFLRDLHEDTALLGRAYFPAVTRAGRLTEEAKRDIVAEIREDLACARRVIPLLPRTARVAVTAATDLFAELNELIDATPAHQVVRTRLSVPPARKAAIVARAAARALRPTATQGGL